MSVGYKERNSLRVGGVAVGQPALATQAITSDPLLVKGVNQVTLLFTIPDLIFSGNKPTITFQSSNIDDPNSFVNVTGAEDIIPNELLKDYTTQARYIRFLYDPKGTVSGTLTIDFRIFRNF